MASVVNLPASLLRFYPPGDCSQDRWLEFLPGEEYRQRIKFDTIPSDLSRFGLYYKVGDTLFPLAGTLTQIGSLNEYALIFDGPNVACSFSVVITELIDIPSQFEFQGYEVNQDGTFLSTRTNAFAAYQGTFTGQTSGVSDQDVVSLWIVTVNTPVVSRPCFITYAYRYTGDTNIGHSPSVDSPNGAIISGLFNNSSIDGIWIIVRLDFNLTASIGQDVRLNLLWSPGPSVPVDVIVDALTFSIQGTTEIIEIAQSACFLRSRDTNSSIGILYESSCNVAGYSYAVGPPDSAIRVSGVLSDALPQIEEDLFTTSTGQEVQLRATVVLETRASFGYLPADALAALVYALKHPILRINASFQVAKSLEVSDTDRYANISRTLTATLRPAVAGIVFTDCCS